MGFWQNFGLSQVIVENLIGCRITVIGFTKLWDLQRK
jgi:hypothetical protein